MASYLSPKGVIFRLRKEIDPRELVDDKGVPKDWLESAVVRKAFDMVVVREQLRGTDLLVCDNFPGNAEQVDLLAAVAGQHNVMIVRLMVAAEVIGNRLNERRVCMACESDPLQDPRSPAARSFEDSERCAACASPLLKRPGDSEDVRMARIRRFDRKVMAILARCRHHDIGVCNVDATQPTAVIGEAVLHNLTKEL